MGGGVLLDIGANIGKFSVIFAMNGWTCCAIEASTLNSSLLKITAKLNDLAIDIEPYILHEKTGKMFFYQNGPFGLVSTEEIDEKSNQILGNITPYEMDAICLNDWKTTELKKLEKVDFIKMDIEGSEVAAVRGGGAFFQHFGFPPVFCESNKWTLYLQKETPKSLIKTFENIGYKAYKLVDDKLYGFDSDLFQMNVCEDFIFVHENNSIGELYGGIYSQGSHESIVNHVLKELKMDDEIEVMGTLYSLMDYDYIISEDSIKLRIENMKKLCTEETFLKNILDLY